jgi:hypothetical protein
VTLATYDRRLGAAAEALGFEVTAVGQARGEIARPIVTPAAVTQVVAGDRLA